MTHNEPGVCEVAIEKGGLWRLQPGTNRRVCLKCALANFALRQSIGDGWEFEKQKFSMSTKVDRSNNVEFGTSAQLLPMQCCVQLLRSGSTRWVVLTGRFAFKIPSLHSWKNFLWGLLANMQEVEFSKCRDMKEKLCPVKFYLPLGFLVVMPKVRILTKNELPIEALEKFCLDDNFKIPAELKHDSFGYFKGKLVAVDYG